MLKAWRAAPGEERLQWIFAFSGAPKRLLKSDAVVCPYAEWEVVHSRRDEIYREGADDYRYMQSPPLGLRVPAQSALGRTSKRVAALDLNVRSLARTRTVPTGPFNGSVIVNSPRPPHRSNVRGRTGGIPLSGTE